MRTITLGLVIVALVVLAIGLAGSGTHVDVRYIAGTWHKASLLGLAAIVAGLVLVCGLAVAVVSRLGQAADRKVLEEELQRTYVRLRHAEAELRASSPVLAASGGSAGEGGGPVSGEHLETPGPPGRGAAAPSVAARTSRADPIDRPATSDEQVADRPHEPSSPGGGGDS